MSSLIIEIIKDLEKARIKKENEIVLINENIKKIETNIFMINEDDLISQFTKNQRIENWKQQKHSSKNKFFNFFISLLHWRTNKKIDNHIKSLKEEYEINVKRNKEKHNKLNQQLTKQKIDQIMPLIELDKINQQLLEQHKLLNKAQNNEFNEKITLLNQNELYLIEKLKTLEQKSKDNDIKLQTLEQANLELNEKITTLTKTKFDLCNFAPLTEIDEEELKELEENNFKLNESLFFLKKEIVELKNQVMELELKKQLDDANSFEVKRQDSLDSGFNSNISISSKVNSSEFNGEQFSKKMTRTINNQEALNQTFVPWDKTLRNQHIKDNGKKPCWRNV